MKITPREGDYVSLGKEKSGNLIHFIDANEHRISRPVGFSTAFGDYPSAATVAVLANESLWFMVFCSDGKFHFARTPSNGRELSLSDLLGDDDTAWPGEGLPPVGAECEYNTGSFSNKWQKVYICGIAKDGRPVHQYSDGHVDLISSDLIGNMEKYFRPLKSERDIAIEEMVKYLQSPKRADTTLAEDLYDFGFRIIKDAEK